MIISNTDHEKFGSKKMDVWSEKDLSQFLIFDYCETSNTLGSNRDNEERIVFEAMKSSVEKYNRYKYIVYLLDKFPLRFFKNIIGRPKKKILFYTLRYPEIVFGARKRYDVGLIVQGKTDRINAFRYLFDYIGINDAIQYVYDFLKEKNIDYLYQLVEKTEEKLKKAKPDYIVLWNDCSPIARAIVLASKNLGITTMEIQHGTYNSSDSLINGRAADYVLVWGKYFKDLYVGRGIRKPEDIYILGYPYPVEKNPVVVRENKDYRVCYLGEDFEKYNGSLLKIKLETIEAISKICRKNGLKFVYRPHPGDDVKLLKEKLPGIRFIPKKEKIDKTFRNADIFISFSSTSLREASMFQKISIQLVNYPEVAPNFEQLGLCNKTLHTFEELENYLTEIISAPDLDKLKLNFNNDYVETRYNPIERFLEIIDRIGKGFSNEIIKLQ